MLRRVLILVAAVVLIGWLLSLPRLTPHRGGVSKVDLSRLVVRAENNPRSMRRVVFDPSTKQITATLTTGKELAALPPPRRRRRPR